MKLGRSFTKMSRSEITVRRRQRHQKGNLFEKCGAFYIRYYTRIGGVLKQKTKKQPKTKNTTRRHASR